MDASTDAAVPDASTYDAWHIEDTGVPFDAGSDPDASRFGNGIDYHGGPVILNGTNVYFIWYGNWTGNTAKTILPDLISGLSGSPYFNINTTYILKIQPHCTAPTV
jgi:hypothetical protein